jgi:PadR family transcriptional regulator, regulatory protein PadR
MSLENRIEEALMKSKTQMRRGVLEMCILSIIAEETIYPSDIIKKLKGVELIVQEGTLYPLLSRLKNDGLLAYEFIESTQGPPRKYFKITDDGRQFLHGLLTNWEELINSVNQSTKNITKNEQGI